MIVVAPTLDRLGPVVGDFGQRFGPAAGRRPDTTAKASRSAWNHGAKRDWCHRWYHIQVEKTTVYLPADLKVALRRAARRRGVSEAEVIRAALTADVATDRPRPSGSLFHGESISGQVDDLLAGFGDR